MGFWKSQKQKRFEEEIRLKKIDCPHRNNKKTPGGSGIKETYSVLQCTGFLSRWLLCCGAWALGARASVLAADRLWSVGSVIVACRLSCFLSCGVLVPQPGIELMSPALQGRLLTTGPPGKSHKDSFIKNEQTTTEKNRKTIGKIN